VYLDPTFVPFDSAMIDRNQPGMLDSFDTSELSDSYLWAFNGRSRSLHHLPMNGFPYRASQKLARFWSTTLGGAAPQAGDGLCELGEEALSTPGQDCYCAPLTCANYAPSYGQFSDGCGGILNCQCIPRGCPPNVQCGDADDGCGGTAYCGSCANSTAGHLCMAGRCTSM
jgi:hypothetical protein